MSAIRRPAVSFRTAASVALALVVAEASGQSERARLDLGSMSATADYAMLRVDGVPNRTDADDDGRLRVAFVGDAFIERAAAWSYLESELTRLWPDRDIAFRNLGWAGDDVRGAARVEFGPGETERSSWKRPERDVGDYGFRKLIAHIRAARPDVVFVGYGSNVAAGTAGLADFGSGLARLLDTLAPTRARIVLLSPPPRERRGARWPDVRPLNDQLERVARHLGRVAAERGHLFVDAFAALGAAEDFTDNGINLNQRGYRAVAAAIAAAIGPPEPTWQLRLRANGEIASTAGCRASGVAKTPYGLRLEVASNRLPSLVTGARARVVRIEGLGAGKYALDVDGRRVAHGTAEQWATGRALSTGPDFVQAERLRASAVDKNRLFAAGFRPQNKAYIELFRKHERGHHTGEMTQFAARVREREREIAALRAPVSRRYELVAEKQYPDHEVPADVPTPDPAAELAAFEVAAGFQVDLFAANPLLANPIGMSWDERGRLWVATSTTYPHLAPGERPNDAVVVLEDIDRDGRADKSTVFADGLLVPQSVLPARDGAWVTQSSDLLFLRDRDGDGRADERRVVLTGFGNADVHHMIHGLRWGPGGDLFFTQSIYINSFVETPWGVRRLDGSGIWRLRPDTLELDVFARGMVNPWGHAFDRWGQSFATDGAGGGGIAYVFPGSAHATAVGSPRTLPKLNPGRPKECGLEILDSGHVPEAWRNALLTADFRANRVVGYRLRENGSGYASRFLGDFLASPRRSFRPVDIKLGPDGAIYVADWYNPIIDHGEVDFHHPLRDRSHGRIWRVTASRRPLLQPPPLTDAAIGDLLAALRLPDTSAREHARRLLRQRGADAVLPQLQRWLAALDDDPRHDRDRLEGAWVAVGLGVVDAPMLRGLLRSSDHRIRAAAVRVLGDAREPLPETIDWLAAAIEDAHPRVRLEAVHGLRAVRSKTAANLASRALTQPLDTYLDFAIWQTMRELEDLWLPELRAGRAVFDGDVQRLAFALAAVGRPDELAALLRTSGALDDAARRRALQVIATSDRPEQIGIALVAACELVAAERDAALALLNTLLEGADRGRPAPRNASRVVALLTAEDTAVRTTAIRLAGRWKVRAGRKPLLELARTDMTDAATRLAAMRALGALGQRDALDQMVAGDRPVAVRLSAAAVLLDRDPAAAGTAVAALTDARGAEGVDEVFEAFVRRRDGDRLLASALDGRELAADVAAAGIRIAGTAGREMPASIDALTRAGSLQPIAAMPEADALAKLVTLVQERGDPHRGELVYRRPGLACATCHAIGGAGGAVGPDLSAIGGTARIVDLLESLLAPSAKIKEGYAGVVVSTKRGATVAGTLVEDTADRVRLRGATGEVLAFARAEVERVTKSPVSLMPPGLTIQLRRDELIDLVRFLSELGRSPRFRVPAQRHVRTWSVLDVDTATARAALAKSGPAAAVSHAHALPWRPVYSAVDGTLPWAEIPVTPADATGFVRFRVELDATDDGAIRIAPAERATLWIDGVRAEVGEDGRVALARGAHDCVLQLRAAPGAAAIRVEILEERSGR